MEPALSARTCGRRPAVPHAPSECSWFPSTSETSNGSSEMVLTRVPRPWMQSRVDSLLLLCVSGLMPMGWLGEAHCCTVLAAGAVAVSAARLYAAVARGVSPEVTPAAPGSTPAVCLRCGDISDLALGLGSVLGLLAARATSRRLLGPLASALRGYAVEHDAVWQWFVACSWQALYLAVLWAVSVAIRVATVPPSPNLQDVLHVSAFVLTGTILTGLVFTTLHVICPCCIFLDVYAVGVWKETSRNKGIAEWDKLQALLRKVATALHWPFVVVQATTTVMLLCSFSDVLLRGDSHIGRSVSNTLLAGVLFLLLAKAVEVTNMCKNMPSYINILDFNEGCSFSPDKHDLVVHVAHNNTAFHLGEVSLTPAMVLKLIYASILCTSGIRARLAA